MLRRGHTVSARAASTRISRRWFLAGGAAFVGLWLVVLALITVKNLPEAEPTPSAASADAGFARDMAVHHQQAVDLSFIVRDRTDDEDVRRLAFDVINTQANQRGMLLGRLDVWGLPTVSGKPPMTWMGHEMDYEPHDGSLMPGMATNTQMDQLRKAEGKAAEILYLQLLTEHHRGGVDMAQGAVDLAADKQIKALAEGMVRGQKSEMKLMADMLAERGASASK